MRRIPCLAARLWRDETDRPWLAVTPLIQMQRHPNRREPYPLAVTEQRLLFSELVNGGIEYRRRSVISLNTALVLILSEELGGGFAKGVLALFVEQMYLPGLGHSACEQRFGLDAVLGASGLADSLAIDDFIDVPDATAK